MNKSKVLFIDFKVENYHHLIPEVDPNTKVVILQSDLDGIDQIATHLGNSDDVATVHIISHGAKGTLYLGNGILNLDNIHLYAKSIQQWGKCLSADGEILIYGCEVASGKEGKEFVRQLHQLTGANIAASETLTGNVSKGGNWNLEAIFGQLKSALAFTPEVRASYAGVLANIVVDTTNDVVDDSDGVTSLREAIIEANSTPEDDTIQLTAGATYNLTISGSDEDGAATGDLDIVAGGGEITVTSEGEEKAIIDAGGLGVIRLNDRVFHVLEDAALELENVEITGGRVSGDGGGIFNLGIVSLNDSIISGNAASRDGGGIFNSGTASISNSTIDGNEVNAGDFRSGGGIGNSGTFSISNSTISDNYAQNGGGIFNSGTANISNSTISGNQTDVQMGSGDSGGIRNLGTLSIINSTISNNGASDYAIWSGTDGIGNEGTLTITSSIVSGNGDSDVDSGSNNTLISGNHNLIGTGNAIDNFDGNNDQTGVTDPLLGDLADNGGPTLTHLPLPNSPAIDAGSNPNALTTDQRGEPRFVGEGVDIGAVELQTQEITGTPESEILNGTNENDIITGLAGNDTINGRGGDDQIIGSRGSDFLYGKDGNDTLQGRQDNDHLFGGNGNDSLIGGQGRDRFNGGAGDDTLTGGASIDRFIFNTNQEFTPEDVGVDTITDFVPQQDIILLDKSTFTAITSDSGTGFSVNAEFAIVTSDAEAEISPAVIVYNSNNGKLFYNVNGTETEFGSGGEFANLTNTPSISENDFFLRG